jgi:hypothetical protein
VKVSIPVAIQKVSHTLRKGDIKVQQEESSAIYLRTKSISELGLSDKLSTGLYQYRNRTSSDDRHHDPQYPTLQHPHQIHTVPVTILYIYLIYYTVCCGDLQYCTTVSQSRENVVALTFSHKGDTKLIRGQTWSYFFVLAFAY